MTLWSCATCELHNRDGYSMGSRHNYLCLQDIKTVVSYVPAVSL